MGRVHLASQNSLRREVAVKTLKEDANTHAHEALLSEARVTGYLSHPGIIPVHSLGLDDHDRPVLVMKCIEGVPWSDLLADPENKAWSHWDSRTGDRLEVHVQILMKICDALHFAHNQEIIHRDIKPENVHEVVTGGYLHTGKTLHELLKHAATSASISYAEEVPRELAALCSAATAKAAKDRPSSAEEFRLALADYLSHRSSIEVSNAALLRLEAAEASQSEADMGPQERAYHLGSHCAEARFGFQEALRAWPENLAAERGLQRSLALLVDAHLLRRDPVGAMAQLNAMHEPPDELLPKIQKLEIELAQEGSDRARLEDLDRDLDSRTGFKARLTAFLLFAAATSTMTIVFLVTGKGSTLTNAESVLAISGLLVLALASLLFKRKMFFANAFNKRMVAFVMIGMTSILANRIAGWQLGTSIPHVLVGDLLLVSVSSALCGYIVTAWIKWMTPVLLTGAAIIAFVPAAPAPTIFASCVLLSLIVGGIAWLAQARRDLGN
jgi:serine/threonine-protein kinase